MRQANVRIVRRLRYPSHMPETYEPLIQCDACQCLRRHAPCGFAGVPERSYNQDEAVPPVDAGRVIAGELWRCAACGNERVYGNTRSRLSAHLSKKP